MKISLTETAKILNKTEDEVMFFNQIDKIKVTVDQESLNWEFLLADVLLLKEAMENETEEL